MNTTMVRIFRKESGALPLVFYMSKMSADIDACVNLSQMTQQWEETEPLHQARGFHASCVHENRVFVAGAGEIGARATDRQTVSQSVRQTDRQTG